MKVLLKPKVTKPWSREMYDYNDKVAKLMKSNILDSIEKNKNNWNILNELMVLCGGIKYGSGYTIEDLYKGCLEELKMVQNYWLNEEYSYAVKQGLVKEILYNMVGYDK
jgi:hypothetical protein